VDFESQDDKKDSNWKKVSQMVLGPGKNQSGWETNSLELSKKNKKNSQNTQEFGAAPFWYEKVKVRIEKSVEPEDVI